MPGAQRPEVGLDPLELETDWCTDIMCVLVMEPESSERAANALNPQISLAQVMSLYDLGKIVKSDLTSYLM